MRDPLLPAVREGDPDRPEALCDRAAPEVLLGRMQAEVLEGASECGRVELF